MPKESLRVANVGGVWLPVPPAYEQLTGTTLKSIKANIMKKFVILIP